MLELILHFHPLRYPRQLLATVYAVCAIGLLAAAEADAHELEDGFVERSVAVVVRPNEAVIKYSIGANEITRQKLTDSWNEDSGDEKQTHPTQEGEKISFLDSVGEAVVRSMTVEADGNPVDLELVEVMPTPRHHVEATVVLRFKLPSPLADADSILLEFNDRIFEKGFSASDVAEVRIERTDSPNARQAIDGAFRYALKGANGAMLNRSTVAPILVRAKRKLIADIPADRLEAEQQFSAEVILP